MKREEIFRVGAKLMQVRSILGVTPDNYDHVRGMLTKEQERLVKRQEELRKELYDE